MEPQKREPSLEDLGLDGALIPPGPPKISVGNLQRQSDSELADRELEAARDFRFRCPYCKSTKPPIVKKCTSSAGWICFWVTTVCCLVPINFLFLFLRAEATVCSNCQVKIT